MDFLRKEEEIFRHIFKIMLNNYWIAFFSLSIFFSYTASASASSFLIFIFLRQRLWLWPANTINSAGANHSTFLTVASYPHKSIIRGQLLFLSSTASHEQFLKQNLADKLKCKRLGELFPSNLKKNFCSAVIYAEKKLTSKLLKLLFHKIVG